MWPSGARLKRPLARYQIVETGARTWPSVGSADEASQYWLVLSCPVRLLAAEMLTVSGLQCQASLCCCMAALQMFTDWYRAM